MIVYIVTVGAAQGALIGGNFSDNFGRRPVLIASDVFFTVGSLAASLAPTIWCLMLARFILGLGVGIASKIVPLYLSEMAPV